MPGPSWRDLERRGAIAPGRPGRPAAQAPVPGNDSAGSPAPGIDLPEPLQDLLEERRALEARMASLTGAETPDPRTAALYQVQPLAQRRAEHDAWQRRRDAATQRAVQRQNDTPEPRRAAPPVETRPRQPVRPDETPPLRATPGEQLRRPQRGAPLDTDRFSAARDQLSDMRRQLRSADRQMAEAGMDREREDLSRATRDMGLDHVMEGNERLGRDLDRVSALTDAPRRAERVIEDDWLARRERIGGPDFDTYQRGFRDRMGRLFNVATGSVAQLQERSDRLRSAARERRAAERRQEE